MVYYEERIHTSVKCERDGIISDKIEHTASRLVRMNIDGSEREILFEYVFYDADKIIQNWANHCHLSIDFVKDGYVICLFRGDRDTIYYFIDRDGNDNRLLGIVRGTSSYWLDDIELVGRIGDDPDIHMRLAVTKGKNETIVFRLTIENKNHLYLYSNDYTYSCGAFVEFDSLYVK